MPEERPVKPKKIKTWVLVLLILALFAMVVIVTIIVLDGRHVRFYMTDSQEIQVAYGKPYEDPGCYAVSIGRITGEEEEHLPVTVSGKVNTDKLGTYTVKYTASYHLGRYSTTRTVHVVDMTGPVITLLHLDGYEPSWFTGYEEEGFTAIDDVDGDVTDQVTVMTSEDQVDYIVEDAAGNVTTAVRKIVYNPGRPEITLEGGEEVTVAADMSFADPGYSAADERGQDLTEYVEVTGDIVPYRLGTYEMQYTISNNRGGTVSASRKVNVVPAQMPETVQPEGRVIYLTFDDGPGPYTGQLLDLLSEYGVRATFFVTCRDPAYADMVGRAYREGHAIGVHTASHNYYEIYASEEAYFADFEQAEQMIYAQTGSRTRMFRFPGGSSNTVSQFNPGIMSRLTGLMTDMGYRYFDWNVSSGDAGETTKSSVVLQNVVDGCSGQKVSVVLQHDIKDFSVNAVEKIISWGLRNGYTFLPLDMSSPTMHHRLFN